MTRRIHRLIVPLVFPAGVAPGEGSDANRLTLARDGAGRPVLRGSSLAGALRHAWEEMLRRPDDSPPATDISGSTAARYFGNSAGEERPGAGPEATGSPLQVGDVTLNSGKSVDVVPRTHHLRNRHTGVVADGGLFAIEVCPPGVTGTVVLWLRDDEPTPEAGRRFLETLTGFLDSGLTLGGKASRGVGAVELAGDARHRVYDLRTVDGYSQWLDEHRAWRSDPAGCDAISPAAGEPLAPRLAPSDDSLQVVVRLGIPRGQDLLVGDGQGEAYEAEPQVVQAADGRSYWRLPGASLRGLFRGWMTRLAAREGLPVADRAEQAAEWQAAGVLNEAIKGDELGWCFLPRSQRDASTAHADCPIADLFGSLFQAGRIHIRDAYSPCGDQKDAGRSPEVQVRAHVAIDRVTGGAAESLLFSNSLLTAGGKPPVRFEVVIRIARAREREVRWLVKCLRALDLGLLRVGSSKSSGRLSLVETPQARGVFAPQFETLRPTCEFNVGGVRE